MNAAVGNRWRTWWEAARPRTLPAAVAPVVVGGAVAFAVGSLALWPLALALIGAAAIQVGTNFANDLFDAQKGADGPDRLGPVRAVASGAIAPATMKRAMVLAFAVSVVTGGLLTLVAGWPVVAIGVASIISGVVYTGGPFALAYNGLGDLFVFIFFGLVAVVGTVYVQTLTVPAVAWWAAVPIGLLATAIIVVNNLRDRVTDARVGKRTLIVRFGATFGHREYMACVGGALVTIVIMALVWRAPFLALPLVATPTAWRLVRRVTTTTGADLNPLLGETARLLLVCSVLLAIGFVATGERFGT